MVAKREVFCLKGFTTADFGGITTFWQEEHVKRMSDVVMVGKLASEDFQELLNGS